jgi:acetyl-CoA carboxylase biotin carboxyl carrier protein
MELKEIQELIKMVKKADLVELRVKEGDFAITIKNKADQPTVYAAPATSMQPVANQQVANTQQPTAGNTAATETANANVTTFKSPMVGTFYRKPSADKDTYVKVGDVIKNGDVLCIIEAMKLFNEIEFDGGEGKIVKVLVDDASPVEYDQPLFLIEKV